MCKKANYQQKKYNILKILHKMSVERYKYVRERLPETLGICKSTFDNWLYYTIDDTAQIPHDKLEELAQLLNVTLKDLINYPIKQHQPINLPENHTTN